MNVQASSAAGSEARTSAVSRSRRARSQKNAGCYRPQADPSPGAASGISIPESTQPRERRRYADRCPIHGARSARGRPRRTLGRARRRPGAVPDASRRPFGRRAPPVQRRIIFARFSAPRRLPGIQECPWNDCGLGRAARRVSTETTLTSSGLSQRNAASDTTLVRRVLEGWLARSRSEASQGHRRRAPRPA
jgi:hypothetical protein